MVVSLTVDVSLLGGFVIVYVSQRLAVDLDI